MSNQNFSTHPFDRRSILGLVAWFALAFAAAWLGSSITRPEIPTWYAMLRKPSFNPPDWLFAPVWTTLYALMAISAWLIWRSQGFRGAGWPLAVFLAQLALNVLWSILFFGRHELGLALGEIALLWATIALMVGLFWRQQRLAGALQIPYLLWVSFAALLNYEIWQLNS
jgi:benzodiazapine receptor